MIRKIHISALLLIAAVCMMFTSCSDAIMPETVVAPPSDETTGAWLALSILTDDGGNALVTRAEDYADGDAAEYAVNKAVLLLFTADTDTPTDEQLTFHSIYPLTDLTPSSVPYNSHVTRRHTAVAELPAGFDKTKKYFAFVMVNWETDHNHIINIMGKPDYLLTPLTTFASFAREIATNRGGGLGNFSMVNMPLASKNGDDSWASATVATLPRVPKFFTDKTAALAAADDEAVNVYVERMVVKITVNTNMAAGHIDGQLTETTETNPVTYKTTNLRWVTENRPTYCYLMRQVPNATTYLPYQSSENGSVYRFAATTPMATGADLYRILWAEDCHYDVTGGLEPGPNVTLIARPKGSGYGDQMDYAMGKGIPGNVGYVAGDVGYTMENTMDADHLTHAYTTRLIIRAQFDVPETGAKNGELVKDNPDSRTHESFYTVAREGRDRIFLDSDETGVDISGYTDAQRQAKVYQDYLWQKLVSLDRYKQWKTDNSLDGTPDKDIFSLIIHKGDGQNHKAYIYSLDVNDEWKMKPVEINTETVPYDGVDYGSVKLYVTPNQNDAARTSVLTTAQQNSFLYLDMGAELAQLQAETSYYYCGLAYYQVFIRHFDDNEVNDFVHNRGDYNDIYPASTGGKSRAENYLGRYGLVRNTWYELTLDGIRHLGASTEPPLDGDSPDDIDEEYIGLRVDIVNWARRSQDEELNGIE